MLIFIQVIFLTALFYFPVGSISEPERSELIQELTMLSEKLQQLKIDKIELGKRAIEENHQTLNTSIIEERERLNNISRSMGVEEYMRESVHFKELLKEQREIQLHACEGLRKEEEVYKVRVSEIEKRILREIHENKNIPTLKEDASREERHKFWSSYVYPYTRYGIHGLISYLSNPKDLIELAQDPYFRKPENRRRILQILAEDPE